MSDLICRINEYLAETTSLLDRLDRATIVRSVELLLECYRRQGRVWTLGNGGSASTAQHFACDLAKFVIPPGARPFDTRCLTDNVSLFTAWANDAAREDVFANQMRGLLRREDVAILISVHGGKDLPSRCSLAATKIPPKDRLRLANAIVAEFIEGNRGVIPELV